MLLSAISDLEWAGLKLRLIEILSILINHLVQQCCLTLIWNAQAKALAD